MERMYLNGLWEACCKDKNGNTEFSFEGNVPGCVHSDLSGTKIPKDIYYRSNSDECQWIENMDWLYKKSFMLEDIPENANLVFACLDTYTDIYLNGEKVGKTDNMFISHSFDIKNKLKKGENTLEVYFRSPVRMVEGLPSLSGAFTTERMHTRRMQCTYGWDWVQRFVTCGISGEVYIDFTSGFGVKAVYVYTEEISRDFASVIVEAEFINFSDGGFVDVKIISPAGDVVFSNRYYKKESFLKEYIDIPSPELWYPAGYGEQPLYKLIVGDKEVLFGIRKAKILELPDEKGSDYYNKCLEIKDSVSGREYDRNEDFSGFCLLVNNIPIMCKGANFVPSEPFISEETDEKISCILNLAKEAGVNMLRVWGGGIFERDHFYNECDRLGILVTQDFLMACGQYPENEEGFINNLRKETQFAAYKLRNHPCLMWWSGDNENAIMGYDDAESYQGRRAIYEGIYPVLNSLDPKRRFLLSSPCGGTPYASKTKGTTHNTQYLGCSIFPYIMDSDMNDYKEHFSQYLARFIAEEPTMGAVSLPSLMRFMTADDIFNKDEMWNYHTKSNPCLPFSLFDVLISFTKKVLGDFTDGEDRYFKMKYIQYEWIRISMENIRRNRGFINGIVYWMWNDCWPASSGWAFVDYYCLPKHSFYSFKRCAKKLLLSIDKKDGYNIYLSNDGITEKEAVIDLYCLKDGKLSGIGCVKASVNGGESRIVHKIASSEIPEGAVLIADIRDSENSDRAFYKEGSLHIVKSEGVEIINKTHDSITLKADRYVHITELEGEYIFSDNCFSLFPGEERTINFRNARIHENDEITVSTYTLK